MPKHPHPLPMTTHTDTPDGYLPLDRYPGAIAEKYMVCRTISLNRDQAQQDLRDLVLGYQAEAANNPDLTNATKRDAYVAERRQTDPAYGDAELDLADRTRDLEAANTNLVRLQDEFRVVRALHERGTALVAAGLPGLVYDLSALRG